MKSDTPSKAPAIGVCAAFHQGYEILSFLLDRGHRLTWVATCHQDTSPFEQKISDLCARYQVPVHRQIQVNEPSFVQALRDQQMDAVILAWWPDIVKQAAIDAVRVGWINLHPSLLPYGRGKHGYYWSIVEKKPFGVTIHLIDRGIDTGNILFQKEIPVSLTDTGEILYDKGVQEVIALFKMHSNDIMNLSFTPKKQDEKKATYHHSREIETHSHIQLDSSYNAEDLLNIIRGRTFSHGPSAFFTKNNTVYRVRISIEEEKE